MSDRELAAQTCRDYRDGTDLTDEGLRAALDELPPVVEFLRLLGDEFAMPTRELTYLAQRFEGFQRARESGRRNA